MFGPPYTEEWLFLKDFVYPLTLTSTEKTSQTMECLVCFCLQGSPPLGCVETLLWPILWNLFCSWGEAVSPWDQVGGSIIVHLIMCRFSGSVSTFWFEVLFLLGTGTELHSDLEPLQTQNNIQFYSHMTSEQCPHFMKSRLDLTNTRSNRSVLIITNVLMPGRWSIDRFRLFALTFGLSLSLCSVLVHGPWSIPSPHSICASANQDPVWQAVTADRLTDEWMKRRIDGRTDGRTDEWSTAGWVIGSWVHLLDFQLLPGDLSEERLIGWMSVGISCDEGQVQFCH